MKGLASCLIAVAHKLGDCAIAEEAHAQRRPQRRRHPRAVVGLQCAGDGGVEAVSLKIVRGIRYDTK